MGLFDELGYYFRRINRSYPLFWGLFPVAAVVAIVRFGPAETTECPRLDIAAERDR